MLIVAGLVVGLLLGLLGGGGGIVTVPTLVYVGKFAAKEAVANTLVILAFISCVSAWQEFKADHIRLKGTLVFALASILGNFVGARVSVQLLSEKTLLLVFVCTVFVAALIMAKKALFPNQKSALNKTLQPLDHILLVVAGLFAGLLGGMVGVGGGFLMVPALNLIAGYPMTIAVGTNLLIISAKSAVGALGYLGDVTFHPKVIGIFVGLGFVGAAIGAKLRSFSSEKTLRVLFSLFLFIMGALIWWDRIL